ncbi:aminotransferase class V-fold PLP-dependent enzyme [Limibacter armeniacum]|uniref:aminotransferase class V-fold PLP-dependent enzyme n=1 Tax=Limibacter armeniacum TaxID=466084 RepID=UPI002FE57B9B
MISFYPGPSKVYPELKHFMMEAMDSGILSVNHRSPEFVEMCRKTVSLLKQKLDIPSNYSVYFTSSATECWEILTESFIDQRSLHVYSGAFGEKWMNYRKKLTDKGMTEGLSFPFHREIGINKLLSGSGKDYDILCLTSNETSNATKVSSKTIHDIHKRFKDALVMVDATSSMAGVVHDWISADVWFASVQKCFGLPAGLAVMVCSPKAVAKARSLNHNLHYNSLAFIDEQMQNYQTTYTPNVLNIYLLMRVMEMRPHIKEVSKRTKMRMQLINHSLTNAGFELLVPYTKLRSDTVTAVKASVDRVTEVKAKAKAEGFMLGNGYGHWKPSTFRVANFPAISDREVDDLLAFMKTV